MASLEACPQEIIDQIAQYLQPEEIARLYRLSRAFHRLLESAYLEKVIVRGPEKLQSFLNFLERQAVTTPGEPSTRDGHGCLEPRRGKNDLIREINLIVDDCATPRSAQHTDVSPASRHVDGWGLSRAVQSVAALAPRANIHLAVSLDRVTTLYYSTNSQSFTSVTKLTVLSSEDSGRFEHASNLRDLYALSCKKMPQLKLITVQDSIESSYNSHSSSSSYHSLFDLDRHAKGRERIYYAKDKESMKYVGRTNASSFVVCNADLTDGWPWSFLSILEGDVSSLELHRCTVFLPITFRMGDLFEYPSEVHRVYITDGRQTNDWDGTRQSGKNISSTLLDFDSIINKCRVFDSIEDISTMQHLVQFAPISFASGPTEPHVRRLIVREGFENLKCQLTIPNTQSGSISDDQIWFTVKEVCDILEDSIRRYRPYYRGVWYVGCVATDECYRVQGLNRANVDLATVMKDMEEGRVPDGDLD